MINKLKHQFSIEGELHIDEIATGFPVIRINNAHASALISLYGGQLLDFKPHDQDESVIWLSDKAVYKSNHAIRGGVPVCWPWFGAFDNSLLAENSLPAHGYARTSRWNIQSTLSLLNGGTELVLQMPCNAVCQQYRSLQPLFNCDLSLRITVAKALKIELITKNNSQHPVALSEALHTYLNVSNIHNITVQGLEHLAYEDKVSNSRFTLQEKKLRMTNETDSVFIDTSGTVQLCDPGFSRQISISKENSLSTIIWNPWQEKSSLMVDMSDKSWLTMICIESANVLNNKIVLEAGQIHYLSTLITVDQLT